MEDGRKWWRSGTAGVVGIALGTVAVHLATGWRYGFDRDELMALEDARHLAWGYVQYPPMTAFLGWVALKLFGTSLGGFRLFAALAQAVAVVLAGLMAKEMARGGEARGQGGKEAGSGNDQRSAITDREAKGARGRSEDRPLHTGSATQDQSKDRALQDGSKELRPQERKGEAGEWAMVVAALAGVPFALGGGALMQYVAFDYVCWVLVAYGMVRLLSEEVASGKWGVTSGREEERKSVGVEKGQESTHGGGDGRWWLVIGAGIGLGMMAKYTMGLLVAGVVAGVLLTSARRYLRSGWLWGGVLLAIGIFLPNLLWEWKRNFVSVEFLRFVHERDVATGVTRGFFLGQLELTMLALPLALAGLWFCFFGEGDRRGGGDVAARYRAVAWMYVVPLVLLVLMQGRDFYLAPAYPMLYAAGAAWIERRSKEARRKGSKEEENGNWKLENGRVGRWIRRGVVVALALDVVVAAAVALPIAPVNSAWWKAAAKLDIVFPDEIGWEEFVEGVAQVWERLPAEEKTRAGILAGNYGEVGALNLYGEKYGLPRAISGVNSSWERGYGEPAPEAVIVVGYSREFLEKHFASCEVGGRTWNKYGVANEETVQNPEIFVCRALKESWEEFWRAARRFA